MLLGTYVYYLFLLLGFAIIGVVYGIRLQMRQNFGKKLATLAAEKISYSEYVSVLGEPKRVGSCGGENGERYKTGTWSAPGASITVCFDQDDYAVKLLNSFVSNP